MNRVLFLFCAGCFLLLPPIALAVRWVRPHRLPWWGVALAIALGGWLFVNAAVYFRFEYLGDLMRADPRNEQLREAWQADGAARVFALLFGWLYGFVYALPFMLAFGLAATWRRRNMSAGNHAA